MIRYLKPIATAAFLVYVGWLVWQTLTVPQYLWDFRAYYYAADAYSIGLNPYDTGALRQHYNFVSLDLFEFVYPPITLILFKPFTWLGYQTAATLFVAIKLAMLISLLYLWQKHFLDGRGGLLLWFFVLLAFNWAAWVDFSSGNISITEQFFLWWAFYFWRKDRLGLFGAGVLAASMFKLTPILFLGLLLFSPNRYRWRYLTGFGGLFGLIMLGSYLAEPKLFGDFVHGAAQLDERGVYNPTVLALVRDLLETLPGAPLSLVQVAIYGVIVLVIGLVTYRPFRKILRQVEWSERATLLIFLACFVYALVMPRFKNYSYILLLPGVYYLGWKLKDLGKLTPQVFWLVAVMLPSPNILLLEQAILPGGTLLLYYATGYYCLWLAFAGWGLYLYYLRSLRPISSPLDQPEPVPVPELERRV